MLLATCRPQSSSTTANAAAPATASWSSSGRYPSRAVSETSSGLSNIAPGRTGSTDLRASRDTSVLQVWSHKQGVIGNATLQCVGNITNQGLQQCTQTWGQHP